MTLHFLPEAASVLAAKVDVLLAAMTIMTGIVGCGILVTIVFFAVKYRRGSKASRVREPAAAQERDQHRLEFLWIALPMLLFVGTFIWAATLYFDRSLPPSNAIEISVIAKQWMWRLDHAGGAREIDELHVPVDVPVKLVMISQDVIHSFFVPAFRVKQDVLPGRYTVLWFTATRTGDYRLFCAEFCGTDHAGMLGHLVVLDDGPYRDWVAAHSSAATPAVLGANRFHELGCGGCHSDHAAVRAPDLAGLYGRTVSLQNGTTVKADERYIRDAVLLPNSQLVAGYPAIMPSFAGQISETDVLELIAYIKSLSQVPSS